MKLAALAQGGQFQRARACPLKLRGSPGGPSWARPRSAARLQSDGVEAPASVGPAIGHGDNAGRAWDQRFNPSSPFGDKA